MAPYKPNSKGTAKPLIKTHGESRNINLEEVKLFALENPELFQGEDDDSPSISRSGSFDSYNNEVNLETNTHKEKSIKKPTNKKASNNLRKTKNKAFYESIVGPDDLNTLKKAKAKYNKEALLDSGVIGLEEDFSNQKTFSSEEHLEKVFSSINEKLVKIKDLELQAQGYKTKIDQENSGYWVLYKYATPVILYDNLDDNTFTPCGSGVFVDQESNIWYLNEDSKAHKYLVKVGSLLEFIAAENPPNYELVKNYTVEPKYYRLEGSDTDFLLSQNSLVESLGIKIIDPNTKKITLGKLLKEQLEDLFVKYFLNVQLVKLYN